MAVELSGEEKSLSSRAISIYYELFPLNQLVKIIAASLGCLQQKYTQQDTSLIDFVSMQFYNTSQMLLLLKKVY